MSFLSREALSLSQITAANADISPSTVPRVAVFTGATAGIGRAALTNLVSRGHPMRVYVLGRTPSRHAPFLASLRAANPSAELIFLEGQLSLLADTARLAAEIARRETAVDALFLCAGFLPLDDRRDTEEGVDAAMALAFYSRVLLTRLLMPLLRGAPSPRVVSILGAGLEKAGVDVDDFERRKPGSWSIKTLGWLPATYTTLAMDRIAREEPKVVVIHNHPGSVATDIIDKGLTGAWWMRKVNWLVQPLVRMVSFTPEQSGERCVYLLTSGQYGGSGTAVPEGAEKGVNVDGEAAGGALFLVDMGMNCIQQMQVMADCRAAKADEKLWEHTMGVLKPYM